MGSGIECTARRIAQKCQILSTPVEELPLLLNQLDTEDVKKFYEARLKGEVGKGTEAELLKELCVSVRECDEDDAITPEQRIHLREIAQEQYGSEGSCEIDEDAIVSASDSGAYVQAWVWVDRNEEEEDEDDD